MAGDATDLTFVLDENLGGPHIPEVLRIGKARPEGRITSLVALGIERGMDDENWMPKLGAMGSFAVVTRDGAILRAAIRREAWKGTGLRLMLLGGKWGQMPRRELIRGIVYWWPHIVGYAESAAPGTAWSVSPTVPEPPAVGIKLVDTDGP